MAKRPRKTKRKAELPFVSRAALRPTRRTSRIDAKRFRSDQDAVVDSSLLIRPHRMRGVKVAWPDAPLTDPDPDLRRAQYKAVPRIVFDDVAIDWRVEDARGQRLCDFASEANAKLIARALNELSAQLGKDIADGLASGAPTALSAADIKRRGRNRLAKPARDATDRKAARRKLRAMILEGAKSPLSGKFSIKHLRQLRKRFVAEAAAAERETQSGGKAYDVDEAFRLIQSRTRRPRRRSRPE